MRGPRVRALRSMYLCAFSMLNVFQFFDQLHDSTMKETKNRKAVVSGAGSKKHSVFSRSCVSCASCVSCVSNLARRFFGCGKPKQRSTRVTQHLR